MRCRSAKLPTTWYSRCASAREAFDGYAGGRGEAVEQRKPIQAFLEAPREIILPALRGQAAPLANLLHGHAQDQHFMDQRRAVCTELMLDAVEPNHGPALSFRDRLPGLAAIDAFPCRIDGPGAALRLLPVALERTPAAELRFVDLVVGVQFCQGIASRRAQGDDLLAGFEPKGIVHLDRCHFGIERQILRASVISL